MFSLFCNWFRHYILHFKYRHSIPMPFWNIIYHWEIKYDFLWSTPTTLSFKAVCACSAPVCIGWNGLLWIHYQYARFLVFIIPIFCLLTNTRALRNLWSHGFARGYIHYRPWVRNILWFGRKLACVAKLVQLYIFRRIPNTFPSCYRIIIWFHLNNHFHHQQRILANVCWVHFRQERLVAKRWGNSGPAAPRYEE